MSEPLTDVVFQPCAPVGGLKRRRILEFRERHALPMGYPRLPERRRPKVTADERRSARVNYRRVAAKHL